MIFFKKKSLEVLIVGILSLISVLTGCGRQSGSEGTTVIISDDAVLTGLYMTHQGMAMEPHYIFSAGPEACFMKISNIAPDDQILKDTAEKDNSGLSENSNYQSSSADENGYFSYSNRVLDCEHASLVTADETVTKRLRDAIINYGALNWHGYSIHKSMKGVLDAGDSYNLYLSFSDGSVVTVNSYNSKPEGWNDFYAAVRDIFEESADYSAYTINEFSEDRCGRIIIEFMDGTNNPRNDFKLDINVRRDLGTWSWSVKLKDSDGIYLDRNTDVSVYKEESIDTYSCGKIIDALNKNRIQTWDGVYKSVPDEKRYMNISIWDSVDDKTVTACGNSVPENYDAARDELVRAIIDFYEERTKSE